MKLFIYFFLISTFGLLQAMEEDLGKLRGQSLKPYSPQKLLPTYWSNETLTKSEKCFSAVTLVMAAISLPVMITSAIIYGTTGAVAAFAASSFSTGCLWKTRQLVKEEREIRSRPYISLKIADLNSSTFPLSSDQKKLELNKYSSNAEENV